MEKMFKLGTTVTEKATGLPGILTHMEITEDLHRHYLFQPSGLNPETGQVLNSVWVIGSRVIGGELVEPPQIPYDVLGTEVEDTTGFKGMVVSLRVHINGCVHAFVQPAGRLAKTNGPIRVDDFDLRRLKGAAIKPLTEAERADSIRRTPSPAPAPDCGPQ